MIQYNRAVEQRNALLKKFAESRTFDAEMIDIWNEQLVLTGNRIYQCRSEFCRELVPVFQNYYNEISGGGENVELIYSSQLNDKDFSTLLNESIDKDRQLQFTTTGVHKDDLLLQMNGFPIKKSGSQGQQKTFLVSMKLANFNFISQQGNITPILLLDDIFDKFDAKRVSQILCVVSDNRFGQIFITDTGRENIEAILQKTNCLYKMHQIVKN